MKSVVIRLKRIGCFKYPVFEIIVILKKSRLRGRFIEKIGYLNPNKSENFFFLNSFRLGFWLNQGAKLRPSVAKYIAKFLVYKKKI